MWKQCFLCPELLVLASSSSLIYVWHITLIRGHSIVYNQPNGAQHGLECLLKVFVSPGKDKRVDPEVDLVDGNGDVEQDVEPHGRGGGY